MIALAVLVLAVLIDLPPRWILVTVGVGLIVGMALGTG